MSHQHWQVENQLYCISEMETRRPIKIGIARVPNVRVRQLQVGNPRLLCLEKTWSLRAWWFMHELEREVKRLIGQRCPGGSEWFDLPAEQAIQFIERVVAHVDGHRAGTERYSGRGLYPKYPPLPAIILQP